MGSFRIGSRSFALLLLGLGIPFLSASAAEEESAVSLVNPGFESGAEGWTLRGGNVPDFAFSTAARSGNRGARVTAGSASDGTSLASSLLPIIPGRAYRLTFQARILAGSGAFVTLRYYDAEGRRIDTSEIDHPMTIQAGSQWRAWSVTSLPPSEARSLGVWIWLRPGQTPPVKAEFDDFALTAFVPEEKAPWPPQYKLSNQDKEKLTESDIPGPDGIVYPNWRYTGVTGGITRPPVVVGPEAFDGLSEKSIDTALQDAIERAAQAGGGEVQLPAGLFYLDNPVFITHSGVVIRGAGRDATHIIFRGKVPYGELQLHAWGNAKKLGSGAIVELWANPKNLVALEVRDGTKILRTEERRDHWGNRFSIPVSVESLLGNGGAGPRELTVTARYENGDTFTKTFPIEIVSEAVNSPAYGQLGVFNFSGQGYQNSPKLRLAKSAARGSRHITLRPGSSLSIGDTIEIEAPCTPGWNRLTGNQAPWGTFRANQYRVIQVQGSELEIDRPLRIDFPAADGAFVRKIDVISRSGIEDLTLEQDVVTKDLVGPKIPTTLWYPMEDLWVDGILFDFAWDCWARGVRVINSGRSPLYTISSRSCEIRDSEFDKALFKGGGGSGYAGFERSFDCLMDNVVARDLRHAPDVQWGSAGNVIRESKFYGSDSQWHAGWTHENLFENNTIQSSSEDMERNGNYGFGLYGSGPSVPTHGPQGPRNVVYGNDISSPKDALVMRGGNEAWLILYNRFRVEEGRAVFVGEKSFDHQIKGNVFVIKNPKSPTIFLTSIDNVGIELIDNRFYGAITQLVGFAGAFGKLGADRDNVILPYEADAPKPEKPVPSLFLWQKDSANAQETTTNTPSTPKP